MESYISLYLRLCYKIWKIIFYFLPCVFVLDCSRSLCSRCSRFDHASLLSVW